MIHLYDVISRPGTGVDSVPSRVNGCPNATSAGTAVSTACGFRSSGPIVTVCSAGSDSTPFSSTTMSWKTWSPGFTGFVTVASTVTVASEVTKGAPTTSLLGSTFVMSSSEVESNVVTGSIYA